MEFKSELANAIQLFSLLCLLFWSFSWNSYSFSFSRSVLDSEALKSSESAHLSVDVPAFGNQHSVLVETFSTVRHATKRAASSSSEIIPSFKEWKEKEMTKYEKSTNEVIPNQHSKLSRRKLNYASSKCGAKILASNPEAKHRIAILSEKADEYMLNPCRVRTWFIIELCDTVEATQIELANYELYSSSPKSFSVFLSEAYPTLIWRFLGTFEGKDQRTMQTFDLNTKYLGKFIKVIIYSHHGKEHYCPLSVIRVLGYSMVQEFDDIENSASNPISGKSYDSTAQNEKDVMSEKHLDIFQTKSQELKNFGNFTSNSYSLEVCALFIRHCFDTDDEVYESSCVQKPICRFLNVILRDLKAICILHICLKPVQNPVKIANFTDKIESKTDASVQEYFVDDENKAKNDSNGRNSSFSEFYETSKDYASKPSHKMKEKDNSSVSTVIKIKDHNSLEGNSSQDKTSANTKYFINSTKGENFSKLKDDYEHTAEFEQKKCNCENNVIKTETLSSDKRNVQVSPENEDSIDSAGLLQKDSVLIKLTSRIKASEVDLGLINKYLQQLSESYRNQMEDMQTLFNHTVRAISVASEKAAVIDYKQQEDIKALTSRINTLNRKIEYLMCGQRDMLKRVVELHGFFLILEIIIISTIFTIFLNVFNRKNTHYLELKRRF